MSSRAVNSSYDREVTGNTSCQFSIVSGGKNTNLSVIPFLF
jgi:hypothetical protein